MSSTTTPIAIEAGNSYPLGATVVDGGVNFSLFSAHAQQVELCLFDSKSEEEIARVLLPDCTNQVWHGFVPGLEAGALYGYRVYGPFEPKRGHRFNPHGQDEIVGRDALAAVCEVGDENNRRR